MSEAYTNFAAVYDELMTDIPYDVYVDLIDITLSGIEKKRILDVGCGTGQLSIKLAKKGADVTGIDLSANMLKVAKERALEQSLTVQFKQQPMQQLDGLFEFDAAVIAIDSLNYLQRKEDVIQTFERIHSALKAGGKLLFDVHSIYKTDEVFMEGPFVYDSGPIAYIWQTAEGENPHSVYSELAFFVRNADGSYGRFDEIHEQRTFPVYEYVEMLQQAGFSIERIFADWEDEAPDEESERIFFQVGK
ncbi:class I SAM-dependent methyltransferase [Sporosarcina sp. HYO08]|uniref:class I SAM-dependent DNA methyltransferase n=1 Tax=Sporosarcina sp. HYO08 TaxID=1759557 RepID=UPI0007936906|nr:class I SAM-dependent methyltransferase [Sporosarcina sp. HYO08]KXH87383.1 methyltransferase [Sporosarcina sp. HYO08]